MFLRPGQSLPKNAELVAEFSWKKLLLFAGIAILVIVVLRRRGVQYVGGFRLPNPFGTVDNAGRSDTSTYSANRFSGVTSGLGVAGTRTPLSQFPPAASPIAPVGSQAQALGYGTAPAGQQQYGNQVS